MKKLRFTVCAIIFTLLFSVSASAYEQINVRLNGGDTEIGALLIGSTTYVPFDAANEILSFGSAEISGDVTAMRAVTPFASISAKVGDCYIEAQGRYLGGNGVVNVSGMLYVPIRSIAKAYNADVQWKADTRSVDIYANEGDAITSGYEFYNQTDLYWLSRIINSEAGAESLDGKILVGNVVLNRVASEEFPNTVHGVIFDREWGVQFTPTENGTIYNEPNKESIIAAKLCLDEYYISREAMYFLNPTLATNFWVPNNRPYLMTVGCHDFYT